MNNLIHLSQRQLRVGEQIRQIISNCFIKNLIPVSTLIDISITVSMVKMSKDLKFAHVYILPLGGGDAENIKDTLNSNKYYFQKEVGKKIKIKFTPKIIFYTDDTFKEAEKINNLLLNDKVQKDLK